MDAATHLKSRKYMIIFAAVIITFKYFFMPLDIMDNLYDIVRRPDEIYDNDPDNGMRNEVALRIGSPNEFTTRGAYGSIPQEMFVSKYEETNLTPDEEIFDQYARGMITDRRPDPVMYAHEEARRTTSNYGKIDMQYYGHRSSSDDVAHPEAFLGFIGAEHADPRGHNVDPDFSRGVEQHRARARFVPLSHDTANEYVITGGGLSEPGEIKRRQEVNKQSRSKFKFFSTQKENRNVGAMVTPPHKSGVTKTSTIITDYESLAPVYSNKSPEEIGKIWFKSKTQNDFGVAKYTQNRSRDAKTVNNDAARMGLGQHDIAEHYTSKNREHALGAIGQMMSIMVKQRTQQDFTDADTAQTRAGKHKLSDATKIYASTKTDADMSDNGTARGARHNHGKTARVGDYTATDGDFIEQIAQKMARAVLPSKDTRAHGKSIEDSEHDGAESYNVRGRKHAIEKTTGGAKYKTGAHVGERFTVTKAYKTKLITGDGVDMKHKQIKYEDFKTESDNTQTRQTNKTRTKNISDKSEVIATGDNHYIEKSIGVMGRKSRAKYLSDTSDRHDDIILD